MFGVGSFSTGMRRPVVALEIVIPRLVIANSMVAMQRAYSAKVTTLDGVRGRVERGSA